jgi:hypothetical protein
MFICSVRPQGRRASSANPRAPVRFTHALFSTGQARFQVGQPAFQDSVPMMAGSQPFDPVLACPVPVIKKTALFRKRGGMETQIKRQGLIGVGQSHIAADVVGQGDRRRRLRRPGGAETLAAEFGGERQGQSTPVVHCLDTGRNCNGNPRSVRHRLFSRTAVVGVVSDC